MFNTCKAKRLLNLLMAFCICAEAPLSYAARSSDLPKHVPQFEGQTYEGIDWFERQTDEDKEWERQINAAVKGDVPASEKIANTDDLSEVILNAQKAVKKAREMMETRFNELGPEKFEDELDRDQIAFDVDGTPVEFTSIEGYPAARVVHQKSGVALTFLENGMVNSDSKALLRYLAHQHINAGRKRPDKFYIDENGKERFIQGRDQIFVWETGGELDKVQLKPRPPEYTKEWWKTYWRYAKQNPTAYTVRTGLMSATAQSVSSVVLAGLFTWTARMLGADIPDHETPAVVAALSFVFGGTLGVWSRFYQNVRSSGSPKAKQRKDEVVNVAMVLGIKAVSPDGLLKTFDIFDASRAVSAWSNILQFILGWKINNSVKQPWNKFGDVLAERRDDQDFVPLRLPILKRDEDTGFIHVSSVVVKKDFLKKSDWYRQFKYYFPRNALTMTDRIWFAWWMHEYATNQAGWYMPWLSTAMLALMVPVSWKLVKNWAHKHYPDSPQTKQIDEESKVFLSPREMLLSIVEKLPSYGRDSNDLSPTYGQRWAETLEEQMNKLPSVKQIFSSISKSLLPSVGEDAIDRLDLRHPQMPVDEPQLAPVNSDDCEEMLKHKVLEKKKTA
jgi:hypothetical protein